jgi:hypothetical protein
MYVLSVPDVSPWFSIPNYGYILDNIRKIPARTIEERVWEGLINLVWLWRVTTFTKPIRDYNLIKPFVLQVTLIKGRLTTKSFSKVSKLFRKLFMGLLWNKWKKLSYQWTLLEIPLVLTEAVIGLAPLYWIRSRIRYLNLLNHWNENSLVTHHLQD